ncbi:MAG: DUF2892 domain-containing protein [Deltaproteobacteria bacterium]
MKKKKPFSVEKGVRIIAGTLVLASLALGTFVHKGWYWLGVFVGLNLIQSAFTDFCPAENMLRALGVPDQGACAPTESQ